VYLLNSLTLQVAQQLFIAVSRYRVGQNLVGVKDGVNVIFATPGLEKFAHNLPFLDLNVYYNGIRLKLLLDYMVAESGGSGSGFDTVLLTFAPEVNDQLLADYVLASP